VSLPVVLREEAKAEFDEAFDYYEARQPGLGVDFVSRVEAVFTRIGGNPVMHAIVFADIRKAVVTRFPYSVYYRAHADRVEVLAVFNSYRDPSIWQGRAGSGP
jgi:plasmid stabilization system protein ParE